MNQTAQQQNNIPDIHQTIIINAPIQEVWKVISTSEGIAQWQMPNTLTSELGAQFTFTSPPIQEWDGIIYSTLVEYNPPIKLSYTWKTNVIKEELMVTFELEAKSDQTVLRLSHTGWSKCSSDKLFVRNMLDKGWAENGLENMKKIVEG
ncbi:SRPBCC family protein [Metabacillus sp. RGM 3146]|uniref:SRPBCC family protein n=1 Tax=Metabacillus sp. RGM 3146 TaxID=3401092 RepID=UPI003B9C87A4